MAVCVPLATSLDVYRVLVTIIMIIGKGNKHAVRCKRATKFAV